MNSAATYVATWSNRVADMLDSPPPSTTENSGPDAPDQGGHTGPLGLRTAEPDRTDPVTVRPSLTIKEAAKACSLSESKIKRMHYRQGGSLFANAWQEDGRDGPGTGPWRIPITDLLQAGLHPNAPEPPPTPVREQGHEPPASTWRKHVRTVIDRDGWNCAHCGRLLTEHTITLDHIVARANGGTDDPENLQPSCRQCNSSKRNWVDEANERILGAELRVARVELEADRDRWRNEAERAVLRAERWEAVAEERNRALGAYERMLLAAAPTPAMERKRWWQR